MCDLAFQAVIVLEVVGREDRTPTLENSLYCLDLEQAILGE